MTALANIRAGGRITASEIEGVAPLSAYKSADQSVSNSTVLVNDSALFVPVLANATYLFHSFIDYEGGTLGSSDFKIQWNAPASATLRFLALGQTTGGAVSGLASRLQATPYGFGTGGAGVLFGIGMWGTLVTSSTAGNLQLQWAQNTSNATATIVHAQSVLALWQIA